MICMKSLSRLPGGPPVLGQEFADALTWWLGEDQFKKEPALPSRNSIAGFCLAAACPPRCPRVLRLPGLTFTPAGAGGGEKLPGDGRSVEHHFGHRFAAITA